MAAIAQKHLFSWDAIEARTGKAWKKIDRKSVV